MAGDEFYSSDARIVDGAVCFRVGVVVRLQLLVLEPWDVFWCGIATAVKELAGVAKSEKPAQMAGAEFVVSPVSRRSWSMAYRSDEVQMEILAEGLEL
eukprot:CAMPEP_0119414740 /NCGR_PEP_ID=MMETSP1335-20130426/7151_1 /TAXON_ID=259385 /ORGANISM="Chrysoculter rhomboideus, Strain RCC1486" /LENGTH=97 /DNA_ID=CAMNT_0007439629 /DNA_START=240 /DNA_END=534 /DNA_ORIENTATION=-